MTAGPDGFRKRDHNTHTAPTGRCKPRVHSFVGSTAHHPLQLPLHPGTRAPGRQNASVSAPGYTNSLDLNPIEQMFAKLRTLLRRAAGRTVEATWKRIGTLLGDVTATKCANCVRNLGYVST